MNETEQLYAIGPLMKAARKFKKFNQADVAQAIGCSQSALSKMEHNLLIPSAPQWFLFSRFTAIAPESLERGIIDRHSHIKFNNDEVSLGFKIPKKYRNYRSQKVREVYPFLKYLEKLKLDKEFITSTGLETEFFLDFDNLINFQLFFDAAEAVIKTHPEDIENLVREGQDDIYWDDFYDDWKRVKGPKELLVEYSNSQVYFQADFQLKIEYMGTRLLVTYVPERHLGVFTKNLNDNFLRFLSLYRKFTLEHLVLRMLGVKIVAELMKDTQIVPLGDRFEIRF